MGRRPGAPHIHSLKQMAGRKGMSDLPGGRVICSVSPAKGGAFLTFYKAYVYARLSWDSDSIWGLPVMLSLI